MRTADDDTLLTSPLVITIDEDELGPGTKVGRYLVIGEVGRGGMGRVLRAYDPKLQRELALKLLRTDALDADAQARLVREARAMAQLSHPNVVAVYDVDSSENTGVILAMELVDGTDLRRWLRSERRPWPEVIARFVAAGRGLACAHQAGLLHRDFKPSNVLLGDDGRERVTDFGLARLATGARSSEGAHSSGDGAGTGLATDVTQAGVVLGTPAYMSPEQHAGTELTPATDQYALCVALWEGLVGERPFHGDATALYVAKLAGPPPWPSAARVPRHIIEALRRGLSVAPASRWPTVDALLIELARDPSRGRRNLTIAAGIVVAGAALWGTARYRDARLGARCDDAASVIDATWNKAISKELERGFAATEIGYAVDTWTRAHTRLDAWAEQWRATMAQACRTQSAPGQAATSTEAASMQCLSEQHAHVAGLLRLLQDPTPTAVGRVAGAFAALEAPTRCTDASWLAHRSLPPQDPALAERVALARAELSEIAALGDAGRHDEALASSELLRESAASIDWTPLRAAVAYQLGAVHDARAEPQQAAIAYEEAFFLATQSGHDELAIRACTGLVFTVGYALAQPEQAARWRKQGEALVLRLGLSDELVGGSLRIATGVLHAAAGDWDLALAEYRAGLDTWEQRVGHLHPKVASVLSNMGAAYSARGDDEQAVAAFDRALQIRREIYGEWHPVTADAWNNVGGAAFEAGAMDDALAAHEAARTIRDKVLKANHIDRASTLNNIANVFATRGEHRKAAPLYREALDIKRGALGPKHPEVGLALSNLASSTASTGDPAAAIALFDEALEILAEGAVTPEALAKTRFAAGQSHWDAGHRSRGVQLVRDSRRAFDKLGHGAARAQLERIDAWLATHRSPDQPVELPAG